jgi:hypothetical protein
MRPRRSVKCSMLAMILIFAGCANTPMLVSEWRNSAYQSSYFKRITVSCLDGHSSIRRNCEDEFVSQLRAVGVDAMPSYRSLPDDSKLDETKIKQLAKETGTDGALIVRSIGVEQKTEVSPSYYPTPGFGILGRNVSATWYGWYGAPRIYRYEEYTSEATLHDLRKNEVVWTGTFKTVAPDDVKLAINSYVQSVIKALTEKNLLSAKH